MPGDSRPDDRQNSGDDVFESILARKEEPALFGAFLDAHDSSPNSSWVVGYGSAAGEPTGVAEIFSN
jgi:hypothetical protein